MARDAVIAPCGKYFTGDYRMDAEHERRLIFSLRNHEGFINGKAFSDAHLESLSENTVCLNLENAQVTDLGLQRLPSLIKLRCIDLDNTRITNLGMNELVRFPNLEELWIESTEVTDTGILALQGNEKLRFLSIVDCDVSDGSLDKLEAAIPGIYIH